MTRHRIRYLLVRTAFFGLFRKSPLPLGVTILAGNFLPKYACSETFEDYQSLSPTGETYAVVKFVEVQVDEARQQHPFTHRAEVELWRRGNDQPPPPPYEATRHRNISPPIFNPNDKMLYRCEAPDLPTYARATDHPRGVVLYGSRGCIRQYGRVAFVRTGDGVIYEKSLSEFRAFGRTSESFWQGICVNEEKGYIILICEDRLFQVSLRDGSERECSPEALLTTIQTGFLEERQLALDTISRFLPKGTISTARQVVDDARQPMALRLRAAVSLKRCQQDVACPDFLEVLKGDYQEDTRGYAALHLLEMMGKEGISPLCKVLCEERGIVWNSAAFGLALTEENDTHITTNLLVSMMSDRQYSDTCKGRAAFALGLLGTTEATEHLLEQVLNGHSSVAADALVAAMSICGPPSVDSLSSVVDTELSLSAPPGFDIRVRLQSNAKRECPEFARRLAGILDRGCSQDEEIARYFLRFPAQCARDPLRKALQRSKPGTKERELYEEALTAVMTANTIDGDLR